MPPSLDVQNISSAKISTFTVYRFMSISVSDLNSPGILFLYREKGVLHVAKLRMHMTEVLLLVSVISPKVSQY